MGDKIITWDPDNLRQCAHAKRDYEAMANGGYSLVNAKGVALKSYDQSLGWMRATQGQTKQDLATAAKPQPASTKADLAPVEKTSAEKDLIESLSGMTKAELEQYAKDHFGVDLDLRHNKADLMDEIVTLTAQQG